jgi:hypothetical protein
LLAISDKFDIPGAVRQAQEALENGHPEPMPGALQLSLGRMYKIDRWISIGATRVVHMPLSELTPHDYQLLGAITTGLLVKYRARLTAHRNRLSLYLPTQIGAHSTPCLDNRACSLAWLTTCHQLSGLLLRNSDPVSEISLLAALLSRQHEPSSSLSSMSTACLSRALQACESALSDGKDELLTNATINELRNVSD